MTWKWQEIKKFIFEPKYYKDIKDGDIVCIKSYYLPDFINKIFKNLKARIILITNDSWFTCPNDIWFNMNFKDKIANVDKKEISVEFDTLCIHGDNPNAIELLEELHLKLNNIEIKII